jgi:putative ABC transport system permease protein
MASPSIRAGAKRHDIGLRFGMTAMMRAKTSVPMYAGLTWSTLAAGIVSALLVGVIVGTYPALRASRLSPVDAIQRE